jgi:hypothetical protein
VGVVGVGVDDVDLTVESIVFIFGGVAASVGLVAQVADFVVAVGSGGGVGGAKGLSNCCLTVEVVVGDLDDASEGIDSAQDVAYFVVAGAGGGGIGGADGGGDGVSTV